MSVKRKIIKSYTPSDERGFLGPDHTARAAIQVPYTVSDPFILLMDDVLDKKDTRPVGGEHPHAGFETVSLLLEGEMGDKRHRMKGGDLQIMTAGSGIVHTETIEKIAKMRLLQLWLNLPKKDRWVAPRVQDLSFESAPVISRNGVTVRLYSGSLEGITSPVKNYTPFILADIQGDADSSITLTIPANYTTFMYVIEGHIKAGEEDTPLDQDQVGWLDRYTEEAQSELKLATAKFSSRIILYSGKPQNEPITSHGPFIADTNEDIMRLYKEYRQGEMKHIATIEEFQVLQW
jgi:redox-sensitive bicupin YhaK (pirin superfamily)